MIKVISGEFKGRLLKSPAKIRPILAQIKKSVFDILYPYIRDCLFLDLYAGSGAVGIEALSRGAKFCIFVEKENLKYLTENIINLNLNKKCYIIKADILKDLFWVQKAKEVLYQNFKKENFDIIFIGAPYFVEKFDKDFNKIKKLAFFSNATMNIIMNSKILNNKGILVVQHSKKEIIKSDIFFCFREKFYGDTVVSFFSYV